MSLATIITNTAGILGAVTGVGSKVHAYERWAADEAAFKTLFVESGKVCGWTLTREATTSKDYVGSSLDEHTLVIRGYYSLDDSANTEATFQNLLETIRAAFHTNRRLGYGTPAVYAAHSSDRMVARTVDHRMFAGILVHYCELVLVARELV
jgi:hypothetical protein